jgi:hypothetical protein
MFTRSNSREMTRNWNPDSLIERNRCPLVSFLYFAPSGTHKWKDAEADGLINIRFFIKRRKSSPHPFHLPGGQWSGASEEHLPRTPFWGPSFSRFQVESGNTSSAPEVFQDFNFTARSRGRQGPSWCVPGLRRFDMSSCDHRGVRFNAFEPPTVSETVERPVGLPVQARDLPPSDQEHDTCHFEIVRCAPDYDPNYKPLK